jgi:GH24 family phage-related lysozyme (muramidase)
LYPYACPANILTIGYGHVVQNNDVIMNIDGKILNNMFDVLKNYIHNRHSLNEKLKMIFYKPLNELQADALLVSDIQKFCQHINPLITISLNQNQYDAIISLCYNIGLSAFEKSSLRTFLNAGNIPQASEQFDKWIYAKGKKLTGLILRRQAEKALFNTSPP